MKLSSWLSRSFSRNIKTHGNLDPDHYSTRSNPNQQNHDQEQEEEELLGVTQQLIDYVKSFTLETFKNFSLPLQDDEANNSNHEAQDTSNVRKDLSDWQERHALLILSKVKELSQLRFKLCPRHLKEENFWRIYFMLVKSHVAEYEMHAIQRAKLKRIAVMNETTTDTGAYEVEMVEKTSGS